MKKWVIRLFVVILALDVGQVSSGIYQDRTHDIIRPTRQLVRPDRIVGSEPVNRGELPWQVSLQHRYGNNGRDSHFCAGTLIGDSWVVTAAHCAKDIKKRESVSVVVGAWDLKESNTEYRVSKVHVANYNSLSLQHDIALLKLNIKHPLNLVKRASQKAIPVAIEAKTEAWVGQRCTISGWGKVSNGVSPHILRAADVEIKSDEDCAEVFASGRHKVFNTSLCAGGGERDACRGDSGGPLVCCEKSTKDIQSCSLSGVVSWGIGCGTPGVPGVYTEVAHYKDWIERVVEQEDGERGVKSLRFSYGRSSE